MNRVKTMATGTSGAANDGRVSSFLLGLSGLEAEGGIASLSRSVVSVLDAEVMAGRLRRADRVVLHDRSAPPATSDVRHVVAGGRQWRFIWKLWRLYRRHRPQMLVFDLAGLAQAVHVPLPGFPPRRYAVFVYGLDLDFLSDRRGRVRALERASTVLALSDYSVAKLRRSLPSFGGVVTVIPPCVEPRKVDAWRALEDIVPAAERDPAALIVGRMWSSQRGKGHDQLIEAWPRVRERVSRAELWIVGDGDDRDRLWSKAETLGLEGAARFLGRVSDRELGRLYRRASVFAMPSRQEGFGLVYAEAMWHGLPCIGSTADAACEVIVDGETGLLVPYGDSQAVAAAVVRLLSRPEHARRLGRAGAERVRNAYSFERFRENLLLALLEK